MVSHEVSFKDAENGFSVQVCVETPVEYDHGSAEYSQSLYLCLLVANGEDYTSAHIPRKQAKKIIKAMKKVLNEE